MENNESPVIAILSIVCALFGFSIVGLILGIYGYKTYNNQDYKTISLVGIVISAISTVIVIIVIITFIVMAGVTYNAATNYAI